MTKPETFKDIISIWPSMVVLARDVGASHGQVLKWSQRDVIPSPYWRRLTRAATKYGCKLKCDVLAEIAERSLEG